MSITSEYELSVIIPAINEVESLPDLITALGQQQGIHFEIIIADGGSHDETLPLCHAAADAVKIQLQGIDAPAGRARQMNAGILHARASDLLFLHADTTVDDPMLLANAREVMQQARNTVNNDNLAGHFPLRFVRTNDDHDGGYYFYESKTTLNRRDCINGDQGFWLSKRYLQQLGGFDESLDYMEDARLANKIFDTGHWITLPSKVGTSARRFESEGLKQRQTLNALLCNFERIGLHSFFDAAKAAYRQQDQADTLNLGPFLIIIHQLSFAKGFRRGLRYWMDTGSYVAENAWQLAFQKDCRRNREAGITQGDGQQFSLKFYDQCIGPLITSLPARVITALLTATWFYGLLITTQLTRSEASN
ncbi:MAG: glycosyltransferase [Gammaproteobacteria bacterium]|nr:glycosyltransferase [Gammaproteobacteria bacterium]